MDYLNIKGKIAGKTVDITLSIPVEDITKQLPDTIKAIEKQLPLIQRAGLALKATVDKLAEKL